MTSILSTSANGTTWSKVKRIPIDPVTSGVDHFIPGIGVDGASSGKTARLAVYYYFLPKAKCKVATCRLEVGYISSVNGGRTWSRPTTVAGPMKVTQLASTDQGRMVGDYISCTVASRRCWRAVSRSASRLPPEMRSMRPCTRRRTADQGRERQGRHRADPPGRPYAGVVCYGQLEITGAQYH